MWKFKAATIALFLLGAAPAPQQNVIAVPIPGSPGKCVWHVKNLEITYPAHCQITQTEYRNLFMAIQQARQDRAEIQEFDRELRTFCRLRGYVGNQYGYDCAQFRPASRQ